MATGNIMYPNFVDIDFNRSKLFSIGVELELQLIDANTKELFSGAPKLLQKLYPDKSFKAELFQSMLEINSIVADRVHDIDVDLRTKIKLAKEKAKNFNLQLLLNGTHPTSDWHEQKITQNERYLRLVERIQWLVKRFTIYGLHVHIGMDDEDKAIKVLNHLLFYIPHMIAVSASSPFWNNEITGLASTRNKIFDALPNAGLPPYLKNWKEFEILANQLLRSNSIDNIRDIWWDIRPHYKYGTLEVRICDAMPTIKENIAVAAFIHCLVAYIYEHLDSAILPPMLPAWILAENKWRATRYGADAYIIVDHYGTSQPLRVNVQKLIRLLQPTATKFGYENYLNFLEKVLLRGVSYQRQLNVYSKNKSMEDVMAHLEEEFETDKPLF